MSDVEKDIEEFRDKTAELFQKSNEHKAAILSQCCANVGAMIALISADESSLLDSISMAHQHIREHAANSFVKIQEAKKKLRGINESNPD